MDLELFANNAIGSLSGALDNSATSFSVASASNFPTTGQFHVLIDTEVMAITGVSGGTWTATRPAPVSHLSGATIYGYLTQEGLDAILTVAQDGTNLSQRRRLNFVNATVADDSTNKLATITQIVESLSIPWEATITLPVLSSFSIVNQESATITTTAKGVISILSPATSGDHHRLLVQSTPGSNWTLILRLDHLHLNESGGNGSGLVARNSSSGTFVSFFRTQSTYNVLKYNSVTSYNGSLAGSFSADHQAYLPWHKVAYTNSTGQAAWSTSPDGVNWWPIATSDIKSFLTSIDQIGVNVNSNDSTYGAGLLLQSWQTSSP